MEYNLAPDIISIVYFFYSLAGVLAGLIVSNLKKTVNIQLFICTGIVICWIATCGIGLSSGFISLAFIPMLSIGYFIALTLLETFIHHKVNNNHRASIFSLISLGGGVIIMISRPTLGVIADKYGSQFAFLSWAGVGIMLIAIVTYMIRFLPKHMSGETNS